MESFGKFTISVWLNHFDNAMKKVHVSSSYVTRSQAVGLAEKHRALHKETSSLSCQFEYVFQPEGETV